MSRRGYLLFAAMCLIWGVPYLLIKVAGQDFPPAALVFIRTAGGALLLLPLALFRRQLVPVLRRWPALVLYTVVEIGIPWLLLSDAERRVSSSLAGLVIAGVPLVTAILVWVLDRRERLDLRRVLGLLVGFGGVAVLLGLDTRFPNPLSVLELGVVVICYAIGPVIIQHWLADVPTLGVVTGSLVLSAVGYAPFAVPGMLAHRAGGPAWASAVGLAVVCTALAFLLFFALIAEVGAARATVITFINPAVAVLLGVGVLSEPLSVSTIVGFALILVGSVLATRRNRRRPVVPEQPGPVAAELVPPARAAEPGRPAPEVC